MSPARERSDDECAARPTIALALGAGGAKGLAHIGAIEEIEAQGLRIIAIAGASMGALIGGIHAAGKLQAYRDWVCALSKYDVWKLVDLSLGGGGLIKGERIIKQLRTLVGEVRIEELPLSYTAVAVDLDREREVWLNRGSLFDAIRASIAIPTVFRPCHIDGKRLVDGALLNPVPVMPLIRENADYLLAVSLDGPAETATTPVSADATPSRGLMRWLVRRGVSSDRPPAPGAFELLNQSMDLMQANLARLRLAACAPDLLVSLPRNVSASYEFYRARELIELGREYTRRMLDAWRAQRGL